MSRVRQPSFVSVLRARIIFKRMINGEGQEAESIALEVGGASPWDRVRRACLVRGSELSGAMREIAAVLAGTSRQAPALRSWCDELDVWIDSLEWAGTCGDTELHTDTNGMPDSGAVAEALCRMGEVGGAMKRFSRLDAVEQRRVAALPRVAESVRAFARDLDDALAAFAAGDVLGAGRVVSSCVEHGRRFDRDTASTLRALPDTWWETLPGMEATTIGEVTDAVDDIVHGVRRLVDALVVAVLLIRHTAQLPNSLGSSASIARFT
ncbi:MAG: hypothetical protein B7733_08755 [Myxococcales bacterium FL481]|nr:MAG: hypothetical protein B7733_08755 [Myxococcales bacterium FL481]